MYVCNDVMCKNKYFSFVVKIKVYKATEVYIVEIIRKYRFKQVLKVRVLKKNQLIHNFLNSN